MCGISPLRGQEHSGVEDACGQKEQQKPQKLTEVFLRSYAFGMEIEMLGPDFPSTSTQQRADGMFRVLELLAGLSGGTC